MPKLGQHHSEESRAKIRNNHADFSGPNHPSWGSHRSEETKNRLRMANTGKHPSAETRLKMSRAGKNRIFSEEHRRNLSLSGIGRPVSDKTRSKMSESHRGPKSTLWRGGVGERPHGPGFSPGLRKKIRERDGNVCMICGSEPNGKHNSVHHIDYNKNNHEESNLVTLCVGCHALTNQNRGRWLMYFGKI